MATVAFSIRYDDPNASAAPAGAAKETTGPAPSSAATSPFRGRAQTLVPYSPSTKEVSVIGGFFKEKDESKQQSALKHIREASTASLSDDSTSSFSSLPGSASPDNPGPLHDLLPLPKQDKTPGKQATDMTLQQLQEAIGDFYIRAGLCQPKGK